MAKYFAMVLSIWELARFVKGVAANPENGLFVALAILVTTGWISLTIDIYRLQLTTNQGSNDVN